MRARTTTVALLATGALGIAACGDTEKTASTTTAPAPSAATGQTASGTTPARSQTISKDLDTKPDIPTPTGTPPAKLVVKDIVEGKGKAAKTGDTVKVQYVGVSYSTGRQFDASWDRQPFEFRIGDPQIIKGWNEGVAGMKAGGRRELVIPPDLAYGADGRPGITPNETLVFVIDLLKVH